MIIWLFETYCLGFLGCCLPPIGNYIIASKIGENGPGKYIGFLDYLGGFLTCSMLGAMMLRGKIREIDEIEGGTCGDCLAACCCLYCSMCQMANHLELDD